MFEIVFRQADIKRDLSGAYEIVLKVGKEQRKSVQNLYEYLMNNDKEMIAKIAVKRKKRSLNANNYMWALCTKIAEKVRSTTKEEVYRKAVRDVGAYMTTPVQDENIEEWIRFWKSKGVGWHAEVFGRSLIEGHTEIIHYFGSSEYNTKQMSVLIDCIVDEAKEQGIETLPPHEIERLKVEWGKQC